MQKRPNASKCFRAHPNVSQRIREGPNRSEHVSKPTKTSKNLRKLRENFEKLAKTSRTSRVCRRCFEIVLALELREFMKQGVHLHEEVFKLCGAHFQQTVNWSACFWSKIVSSMLTAKA